MFDRQFETGIFYFPAPVYIMKYKKKWRIIPPLYYKIRNKKLVPFFFNLDSLVFTIFPKGLLRRKPVNKQLSTLFLQLRTAYPVMLSVWQLQFSPKNSREQEKGETKKNK